MNEIKQNSFEELSDKMDGFLNHIKTEPTIGIKDILSIFIVLLPIIFSTFGFVYYTTITTKTKQEIELREIKKDIVNIEKRECEVANIKSRLYLIEERILVLRNDVNKNEKEIYNFNKEHVNVN